MTTPIPEADHTRTVDIRDQIAIDWNDEETRPRVKTWTGFGSTYREVEAVVERVVIHRRWVPADPDRGREQGWQTTARAFGGIIRKNGTPGVRKELERYAALSGRAEGRPTEVGDLIAEVLAKYPDPGPVTVLVDGPTS